jgi:hypothetical protein
MDIFNTIYLVVGFKGDKISLKLENNISEG